MFDKYFSINKKIHHKVIIHQPIRLFDKVYTDYNLYIYIYEFNIYSYSLTLYVFVMTKAVSNREICFIKTVLL